jgi:hypothetical protein
MTSVIPIDVRREAHRRVSAVLRCLDVLLPDATPARRKKIANRILTMATSLVASTRSADLALVRKPRLE